MQEIDSERRLNILRGLEIDANAPNTTPLTVEREFSATDIAHPAPQGRRREEKDAQDSKRSKKRKLRGEDDTDRDIRLAKHNAESFSRARDIASSQSNLSQKDIPLTDKHGHISLFPEPDLSKPISTRPEKNAEAQAESVQKRLENEDQYTLRFSNAATGGFRNTNGTLQPWYSTTSNPNAPSTLPDKTTAATKDVWGNPDPLRASREQSRLVSNDPLAAIKRGVKQLRESEKQRANWIAERDRETTDTRFSPHAKAALLAAAAASLSSSRKSRSRSRSLGNPNEKDRHRRHRKRDRSRSRDRDRDRDGSRDNRAQKKHHHNRSKHEHRDHRHHRHHRHHSHRRHEDGESDRKHERTRDRDRDRDHSERHYRSKDHDRDRDRDKRETDP